METKCGLCKKNCACSTCKKSVDCKYSTQENCKVCVECGRYEPYEYIKAVQSSPDISRELLNILSLKTHKEKGG